MDRITKKVESESKYEIAKEIKRMKEILGQEYDFKAKLVEETA